MKYKPVKLFPATFAQNRCYMDDRVYTAANLAEKAKDLIPFDLPLCCIDISANVFKSCTNARDIATHYLRIRDVDTSNPIVLDESGFIMDGWHRVMRAIVDGKSTIKAVRFEEEPIPDFVKEGS